MTKEPVHLRSVLEQLLKDFGTPDIRVVTSIVDQWEEVVGIDLPSEKNGLILVDTKFFTPLRDRL